VSYIVEVRLSNLKTDVVKYTDKQLPKTDSANIRLKTDLGYLIGFALADIACHTEFIEV